MTAGARLIVRERRDDDLDACLAVLQRVHEADGYPVRRAAVSVRWLTSPASAAAWVALDGDAVVGHVAVVEHRGPRSAEVSRLFADPAARGCGAGRRLLDVAVDHAETTGRRVGLEVVAGTPAVAFYAHRGWHATGTHLADWADDHGAHLTLQTFTLPPARPHDAAGRLARAAVVADRLVGVLLDQDAPHFLPGLLAIRAAAAAPGRPRDVLRTTADVHARVMVGGMGSIGDLTFWPDDGAEAIAVNERWQALREELFALLGSPA